MLKDKFGPTLTWSQSESPNIPRTEAHSHMNIWPEHQKQNSPDPALPSAHTNSNWRDRVAHIPSTGDTHDGRPVTAPAQILDRHLHYQCRRVKPSAPGQRPSTRANQDLDLDEHDQEYNDLDSNIASLFSVHSHANLVYKPGSVTLIHVASSTAKIIATVETETAVGLTKLAYKLNCARATHVRPSTATAEPSQINDTISEAQRPEPGSIMRPLWEVLQEVYDPPSTRAVSSHLSAGHDYNPVKTRSFRDLLRTEQNVLLV